MTATLDLTENAAFLRVLLSDTLAWRQRLVEHFTFGSGEHVRVSSSYQCEFPLDLLTPFLPPDNGEAVQTISALIPVTTRPKQAMLSFDCVAPDGQFGAVLLRSDIAALQAGYIRELIGSSPASDVLERPMTEELVEAISVFTPGIYKRVWESRGKDREQAVATYVEEGLRIQLCKATLRASLRECDSAAEILAGLLDEPYDPMSSSECVLLALPHMRNPPKTDEEVGALVRRYARSVRLANDAGDTAVLQALADYGRRWELTAELAVPVGQPWRVRIEEDRPLNWEGGTSEQRLALGDARSVHFEVDVTDASVSLRAGRYKLSDPHGRPVQWLLEDVRDNSETLALYTSQEGREPYYAVLQVAFTRPVYVRLTAVVVTALVLAASVVAGVVDDDALVEKLAVLTLPATFAAALLLLREETALASLVDVRWRWALGLSALTLWTVAVARILFDGVWWH